MTDPLENLLDAVLALRSAWTCDSGATLVAADDLAREQLMDITMALGAVSRHVDALRAQVAARVERESRPELGTDSLAKQQGFRSPAILIAATTGTSTGDAVRMIKVGEATAPRMTLTGQAMPARHPHVADALRRGGIGTPAASAIIRMLDRVGPRASHDDADAMEKMLVERAPGLTLDQLAKLIARAEAHLDPDGLEPLEHELRTRRSLTMFERDGMLHLNGVFDPESAAPIRAAIEAIVTAEFRNEGKAVGSPAGDGSDVDATRRTVPQRQADALALIATHVTGCSSDLPLDGATVVVRMGLEECLTGSGIALIDGMMQPISAATARRMAAAGAVIPCVLGSESEVLDWGRKKRLFTPAQKLALAERDGGCAMCGLPPSMCKAHHMRWWERDAGPTDLDNGVLLCESCHHRVHDNGWEIRIEGTGVRARVWFVPPSDVDVTRTPRLGGRARFDLVA